MLSALGFLTIFGVSRQPNRNTFAFFPLVGMLIGLLLAAIYFGLHQIFTPYLAASLLLTSELIITGGLHFDGLGDSGDGLLPHMDTKRRLEAMAEPTVGVFAVLVLICVMLIRFSVFEISGLSLFGLAAIFATSRTAVLAICARLSYVRKNGLASDFLGEVSLWPMLLLLPVAMGSFIYDRGHTVIVMCAVFLASFAVAGLAKRRIGGFTGDVLGASIVLSETVGLIVLSVFASL